MGSAVKKMAWHKKFLCKWQDRCPKCGGRGRIILLGIPEREGGPRKVICNRCNGDGAYYPPAHSTRWWAPS